MAAASWKSAITDPDEVRIFMALDAEAYTWRTIKAVARETGLDENKVMLVLKKYSPKLVRLSREPAASGQPLVGLIERVGS